MNLYGIPSGPGATLEHLVKTLIISSSRIGEFSFVCSSEWGLMLDK